MASVLKIGDRGVDVGDIQQQLIEAGEQIDQSELNQAFFGPSTKIAVLDFQSSHLDPTGHPLVADGLVGPFTRLALAKPQMPTESFIADGWRGELPKAPNDDALTAVAVAVGEIGTKEDPDGSNRGPRVDMYEGSSWLGAPWCALFVSWCWSRAHSGSPFGVQASALKMRDWGARNSALLGASDVLLPGDVGIILRAQGRGHVELVASTEIEGKLSLVGGNVSNAVRGTVRERGAFSHFMRPIRS
jgi:hypothetical protein